MANNGLNWQRFAACRDEDPELFFPVGNAKPAMLQSAQAKAVCYRCPVAMECLLLALDTGSEGIFGGTTAEERRAMRRGERRRAEADIAAAAEIAVAS